MCRGPARINPPPVSAPVPPTAAPVPPATLPPIGSATGVADARRSAIECGTRIAAARPAASAARESRPAAESAPRPDQPSRTRTCGPCHGHKPLRPASPFLEVSSSSYRNPMTPRHIGPGWSPQMVEILPCEGEAGLTGGGGLGSDWRGSFRWTGSTGQQATVCFRTPEPCLRKPRSAAARAPSCSFVLLGGPNEHTAATARATAPSGPPQNGSGPSGNGSCMSAVEMGA